MISKQQQSPGPQ